jgi:serine/threonine protein kinase
VVIDVATRLGDRYRIEARIGGGGMADVFEARDEALHRDVAIKLLRGIDDEAAARRFAEEIRLTARLNHPNVVRLFDAGEHDGAAYLVLERVTGGTLSTRMADGPLPGPDVARIGRQIASALEHAHAEGIVHRDVKPSNVLLTTDSTVRLADFGIALTATATRLTVTGSVAGSAGYVSPEQVLGTGAGAASDVYALGLVLLECLTGEAPWTGTTVEVALARITADPPIPPSVDDAWRGLLLAMTTRNPDDRPPMSDVVVALDALAAGDAPEGFPIPRPPRRRLRLSLAAAGALLVLAGGAAVPITRSAGVEADDAAETTAAPPADTTIAASVLRGAAVGEEPTAQPAAQAPQSQQRPRSSNDRPGAESSRPRTNASGDDSRATADGESTGSATTRPSGRSDGGGDDSPNTDTADGPTSSRGDSGVGDTEPQQTAEETAEEVTGKGRGRREEVRPTRVPEPSSGGKNNNDVLDRLRIND